MSIQLPFGVTKIRILFPNITGWVMSPRNAAIYHLTYEGIPYMCWFSSNKWWLKRPNPLLKSSITALTSESNWSIAIFLKGNILSKTYIDGISDNSSKFFSIKFKYFIHPLHYYKFRHLGCCWSSEFGLIYLLIDTGGLVFGKVMTLFFVHSTGCIWWFVKKITVNGGARQFAWFRNIRSGLFSYTDAAVLRLKWSS